MRLQKATIHTLVRLTLKQAEEFHVPRPGCFFTGGVSLALVRLAGIDEVVHVVVKHGFANDEGAFPWGGQLVLAGLLLDELEDEVSLVEREGLDLLDVVVPQALLVDAA